MLRDDPKVNVLDQAIRPAELLQFPIIPTVDRHQREFHGLLADGRMAHYNICIRWPVNSNIQITQPARELRNDLAFTFVLSAYGQVCKTEDNQSRKATPEERLHAVRWFVTFADAPSALNVANIEIPTAKPTATNA